MSMLKNQMHLVPYTGKWLLDTGDLRQIGKTTALVEISLEFVNIAVVYLVTNTVQQKRALQNGNPFIITITYDELEQTLRGIKGKVVVLLDDARFTKVNYRAILRENEDKIHFKFGWY